MKLVAYLTAAISVAIAATSSVRAGSIILAAALALFALPGIRNRRAIEKIVPLALIVSLITVALALPRG